MTTIAAGASLTLTATIEGQTFYVSVNGGGRATVSGAVTASIGPLPTRRALGPFLAGQSVTVSADSGDVLIEYGDATPTRFGSENLGAVSLDSMNTAFAAGTPTQQAAFQASVSGGGAVALTLAPYALAIPLDGTKRMPPAQITGATAFTVSGTPVAGGTCTLKLTANGTNIPTFPGIHWGGSAGWVNTAGTVNIVTIWNDGDSTYYSVAQHQSAPITLPSLSLAAKSGASSPSILTLSMSTVIGNSGAVDSAQFSVITTNGGAQSDSVLSASSSGAEVTLSMSRPATVGDTTFVTYTPSATLGNRLVDASGNYLYSINSAPVVVQTFLGVLDNLPVSAAGAWSLRRLRSAYTGPIINVTGSVQGAFNVGYNAASGDLDMTRLTGASGETYQLNTMYDQSGGGRNLNVTTSSGKPWLYIAGGPRTATPVYLLSVGGDKINFNGTNLESVFLTSGRVGSMFLVQSPDMYQAYAGGAGGGEPTGLNVWGAHMCTDGGANIVSRFSSPTVFSATPNLPNNNPRVVSAICGASAAAFYRILSTVSGAKAVIAAAAGTANSTVSGITQWGFHGYTAGGGSNAKHFELLQFASDVGTTVRDQIESNQLAYWGL